MKFSIHYGSDYMVINRNKKGIYSKEDIINMFDLNEYIIYKGTSKQRKIDFINSNYVKYLFFNNNINENNLINWLEFFYNNDNEIKYLDKNVPPYKPEKIKIKK